MQFHQGVLTRKVRLGIVSHRSFFIFIFFFGSLLVFPKEKERKETVMMIVFGRKCNLCASEIRK